MADLKLPGVGSGFPIQSFVDATVSAERAPKEKMFATRVTNINVQLSAYGSMKSALSEFQSAFKQLGDEEAFQKRSASLSESGFVTASADKTAVAGSYKLEVKTLAEAHKLGVDQSVASEQKLGSGTFEFTVDGNAFSVAIDQDKSTLAEIAEAINNAEGNTGVRATVINDGQGNSSLVMFAEKTGEQNAISYTVTGNNDGDDAALGLGALAGFTEIQAAQDATLVIDNTTTITSPTNEIKDAIQGVTLNLKKLNDTEKPSTTLTIGYDKATVEKNLKNFVAAFNKVMGTVNQLTSYNPETEQAGPLNGDGTARNLSSQIRRMLSEPVAGAVSPIKSLTDLGITSKKDGTIELDEGLLKKQVDENFEKIGLLFSSEQGVAKKLDDMLESFVGKEGVLTKRDTSLNDQLKKISNERQDFALYMEKYEERIYKQFTNMDIMVAQLNQQLTSVISAFESMPDFGSSKQ
ncbi:flagellar filament capping protein FliD [Zobellella sp. An-6]|uniref:flagellar filament capping protein FliD n=1 Tax=Zobellella sp. An-6 TaxID=3400218 RepID=UPI00404265EA